MSDDRFTRLAAACVMGSFEGIVVPAWLFERIRHGLGGVCLFAQNVVDDAQVRSMCAALHAAGDDLVIAIDEEGGDVTRLDAAEGSEIPCPAAFGAVDDPELTRRAYRSLGARLAGLGIDLSLAPCADINSDPRNPIIGVRSFGATAEVASRHTAASVQGFRDGGVAAAVKHFPGHGDTVADTHLGAARVEASLAEMERRELVPFRAAIAAGVEAVLTAHIIAPRIDDRPASLSGRWTAYLRNELAFDGVVITDALDMGAVAGDRGAEGVAEAAVAALAAGADLLCLGSNFDSGSVDLVVTAIATALVDGRLDPLALERSARRNAMLHHARAATPASVVDCAAIEVARRAVVATGDVPTAIDTIVECRPQASMASFNVTWGLARHLAGEGWHVHSIESAADAAALPDDDGGIVVAVRDLGVHTWQGDVIRRLAAERRPIVVVELGWPSTVRPTADCYIISHGAALVTTRAVADLLVGRARPSSGEGR